MPDLNTLDLHTDNPHCIALREYLEYLAVVSPDDLLRVARSRGATRDLIEQVESRCFGLAVDPELARYPRKQAVRLALVQLAKMWEEPFLTEAIRAEARRLLTADVTRAACERIRMAVNARLGKEVLRG
jgi:hypothetical protein